jgi:hypothetical protein
MATYILCLASLLITALSLAPSFAHVLEAPPRLLVWSPELWRETTVFNGQFQLFASVGAPIDLAAIALTAALTYALRTERSAFRYSLAGTLLLLLALASWFAIVAPANGVLATWKPGPVPPDFDAVRLRWETGHMTVAALKALALAFICSAVLEPRRPISSADKPQKLTGRRSV